jgi:DNA repair protein SbcC/Rad50
MDRGSGMKPILIKMHNVGPFRDEALDFTQLDNMFLIYGNTGAGKTTIFDAMTYALYGVLNGSRKGNVREFRSDFVPAEEVSFVEFTFELAYTRYRVYRTLPQSYITRNGTAGEKAAVVSLESGTDNGGFTLVKGNTIETNEQIEKIIGLSASEFSRIVLLPQGAFSEFLHESSKDRRDTLEKLFPVDSYSSITDEVKILAEENIRKLDTVAAQITACTEKYTPETAGVELQELHEQLQKQEKKQKALMTTLSELSGTKEKLTAKYAASQQNEKNRKHLQELTEQADRTDIAKEQLALAKEAAKLSEFIHSAQQNEKNKTYCSENLKAAQQYAVQVQQELSSLAAQKEVYESLKKDAEEADAALPQQKNRLAQINKLSVLQKKAAQAENMELRAEKETAAASAEAVKVFSNLLATAGHVSPAIHQGMTTAQILSQLSSEKQAAATARNNAQIVLKNAQLRENLAAEIVRAADAAAKADAAYTQALQYASNTKSGIEDLEKRIELQKQNNAACFLVTALADGKPCPVCGSLSHPSPVHPLPESLDVQTQLDTARHNLEMLQKDADKKLQQKAGAANHLEEIQKQLDEAEEAPSSEEAQKNLESAEYTYQSLCGASAESAQYADMYQSLQEKIQLLTQQFSQVKSEASSAHAASEQLADTIRKNPGEALPDIRTLSAEIAALEKVSADGKAAYAKWNNAVTEAGKNVSSAVARSEELSTQSDAAAKNAADAVGILLSQLSRSSFRTPEEAESAFLSDEEQKNLEQSVSSYEDECKKLTILLENAEKTESSADLKKLLGQTEEEIQKTQDQQEQISRVIQDTSIKYNTLNSYISESAALEAKRTELEKEAAPYKMLYSDLSGKNPKNIPFNAWALGMYFEQVIQYANMRFYNISGGRFMFKISSEKSAGGGYKGLDLLVTDSFTGTDRDTSTLSGGETFMASISLALALTDIVQNRNGGIRLDSLFIDEGFGTLDEETLDCAVTVLNSLQETKMVGIISHVESMKTAVPSLVEIVKTAEGSHIRICC